MSKADEMFKELEETIKTLKITKNLTNNYRIQEAIETVLNYIDNSIPKEVIKDKIKELEKQYKEALEENNTKAFILKCQIEGFKDFKKELLDNE